MRRASLNRAAAALADAGLDPDEAEDLDRTPRRATVPMVARRTADGYVHTVHPDTGTPVVFLPGETLPDWADATHDPEDTEPAEGGTA